MSPTVIIIIVVVVVMLIGSCAGGKHDPHDDRTYHDFDYTDPLNCHYDPVLGFAHDDYKPEVGSSTSDDSR